MPSLYTDIEINAPRAIIWKALVKKDDWSRWNTFLFDRTPGQSFKAGRSLLLSLRRSPREAETEFQANITQFQPETCLQWVSTAPGYRSEHRFELQDMGSNRTKYTHCERITGALTWLFLPFIRRDEQEGMRRMALELKRYAEWYTLNYSSYRR